MAEFKEYPKIARLNRDIVITEKLDGTNAAIIIEETDTPQVVSNELRWVAGVGTNYLVSAQSRNRILECGEKGKDNFGFAAWVARHKHNLVGLGVGYHYGEWYGFGIQRTYGLTEKRFALFNVLRWQEDEQQSLVFKSVQALVPNLELVPLLYRGPRMQGTAIRPTFMMPDGHEVVPYAPFIDMPDWIIAMMKQGRIKNLAVPGYDKPEGIVVFHTASRQLYKATLEGDETYKGAKHEAPITGVETV